MKIETIRKHKPIHQIFECFKELPNVAFLDSSLKNDLGRTSIIGLYPYFSISTKDGKTCINGKPSVASFERELKRYLSENREENHTSLPIVSGAIGYFSYNYGLASLGIESKHKNRLDVPDAFLCFYDVFIIEDHQDNLLYIVSNGKLKNAEVMIEEVKQHCLIQFEKEEVKSKINTSKTTANFEVNAYVESGKIRPDFERKEYMQAIEKIKRHIAEGDISVVNMTEQFMLYSERKPFEVFTNLRTLSPSPFGAYMKYEDFAIISSSPERFLKVKDNKIVTCPIKGTRKRGETKEEDERLKRELEGSEKDRKELLMVVNLEKDELNKVCKSSSVKVENLFSVESYAQVFQLVARVLGELKEDIDIVDILSAMFPGGSIAGTPKLNAMKTIDNVEKSSRNLYTGSLGYLALDGSLDLNIIIRTALYQKGVYHVGAGGGITQESDEEFEMEEVLQKAKALFQSILD